MTKNLWKFNIKQLNLKKNLIVVSTETSLVDSIILARVAFLLRGSFNRVFGITKKETWYLKPLSEFLIFVDRDKKLNQVQKIIKRITKSPEPFILFIFPEGTTKKATKWRTGFHYISKETNADICIIGIDHKFNTVNIDTIFTPGDDVNQNINFIKKRLRRYALSVPEYSNLN
jgi:1-acyl-sn-glycerol-3-phosphate acyltransferase